MNHPPSRLWSTGRAPGSSAGRTRPAVGAKNTQAETACHRGVVGIRARTPKLTMVHLGKREKTSPRRSRGRYAGPACAAPNTVRPSRLLATGGRRGKVARRAGTAGSRAAPAHPGRMGLQGVAAGRAAGNARPGRMGLREASPPITRDCGRPRGARRATPVPETRGGGRTPPQGMRPPRHAPCAAVLLRGPPTPARALQSALPRAVARRLAACTAHAHRRERHLPAGTARPRRRVHLSPAGKARDGGRRRVVGAFGVVLAAACRTACTGSTCALLLTSPLPASPSSRASCRRTGG